LVGLLKQERRAGGRAATPAKGAFQDSDRRTSGREGVRDQRARDAAANDCDVRFVMTPQRRVTLLRVSLDGRKPDWMAPPQWWSGYARVSLGRLLSGDGALDFADIDLPSVHIMSGFAVSSNVRDLRILEDRDIE
jgi:hypothetical protein